MMPPKTEKPKRTSMHFFADAEMRRKIKIATLMFEEVRPTPPTNGRQGATLQEFVTWCVERGIEQVDQITKANKANKTTKVLPA